MLRNIGVKLDKLQGCLKNVFRYRRIDVHGVKLDEGNAVIFFFFTEANQSLLQCQLLRTPFEPTLSNKYI